LSRLSELKNPPAEIAVVFSDTAKEVWEYETGSKYSPGPPAKEFGNNSFYAPFASGSSDYDTMIICPSSMGTIGRIANGTSDNLIVRAADVILKERRKLIIVPRETPYNYIHLKNMETLTLAGAIICPASPSFYSKPSTINELVMTVVNRIIDLSGFESDGYKWMEND
jgi:4-hydroxy-3-polyprenylbenzoate decarboxylase